MAKPPMRSLVACVPIEAWGETGPPNNPRSRLTASIEVRIGSRAIGLHLTLIEVKVQDGMQVARDRHDQEEFERLVAADSSYEPFATIEVKGRDYVLGGSPWCD